MRSLCLALLALACSHATPLPPRDPACTRAHIDLEVTQREIVMVERAFIDSGKQVDAIAHELHELAAAAPRPQPPRPDPPRSDEARRLSEKLKPRIERGEILVAARAGDAVITIFERSLFVANTARLSLSGRALLLEIAHAQPAASARELRIAAYVDAPPNKMRSSCSPWDLSGKRALAVVRLLLQVGVDPARLSAIGYGGEHPIASNQSASGRARNRRIEIAVVPVTDAGAQASAE